ncbi:mannose-1-phosphate guanylyltransferase, partial [Candidatus Aerophobetes bacterium]|nr:mannose-1-phosphate guanylyltransferase [Candidatus Aerophobetes bacterium]
EKIGEHDGVPCYKLKRFTEKPSQKKAKSFVESGDFLWNAGIFGWLPGVILEEIRNYLPPLWNGLEKIKDSLGTAREKEVIENVYPELPKISIDYAVMEKTQKAVVIPAQFSWDDIGEWKAVERIFSKDQNGNIIRGVVKEIDTNNCIFINSEDKVLGAIGLSNIIVVNCEGGVLVVNKELSPRVKELVDELLKDDKFKKYLGK